MFRSALATIGVAALAFGAQSWLLGAMAQGDAQPAEAVEPAPDAAPSARSGRTLRKSYLDRLIDREADFGARPPAAAPPLAPPPTQAEVESLPAPLASDELNNDDEFAADQRAGEPESPSPRRPPEPVAPRAAKSADKDADRSTKLLGKTKPAADWEGKPVAFPPLPPDPYAEDGSKLPPLGETLAHHGGAHLYSPEGDAFPPCGEDGRHPAKRLPEWFQPPQPCTRFAEYLGADPIKLSPKAWPPLSLGRGGGYQWEPRFVAHGGYDAFGIAFREGSARRDLIGHNLTLDFDLRLTGTERLHVQHRPIGEDGSGGSFYQFSDPVGYVDNSTAEPARVWFECELASVLSGWLNDPTVAWDMNLAAGKFLLQQHNTLLINDEVAGVILGQNNLVLPGASNLNARLYWLFDDINSLDTFGEGVGNDGLTSNVLGADAAIDFRHAFIELTYAFRDHSRSRSGDAHYLAASATQFFGPATLTGRVLAKLAGGADRDGQLYVVEWATHRAFDRGLLPELGCHKGVFYATGFYATPGWDPIASANFNRLRASFELNPLVQVARGDRDETPGVALGVQLFGPGENSSLTPELAYESPDGVSIFGASLKWQRRTSVQSFVELRGLVNDSDHSPFERDGVFASHHWVF